MPLSPRPFPTIINESHQLQGYVERAFPKLRTVEAAEFELAIRQALREVPLKYETYLICKEFFRTPPSKKHYGYLAYAAYSVKRSFLGIFTYERRYSVYIRALVGM